MSGESTPVRVIRSAQRGHWSNEWLQSWQSFPATGNFDFAANAHGVLMVHNEDTIEPGEGFDMHAHRDVEIITWVLEGSVVHRDSLGNEGVIYPGLAQRMSAGTGIVHAERNGAGRRERSRLRVVQMWIPPDELHRPPGYQELDIAAELAGNTLVPMASGMPKHRNDAAITFGNRYATLHVARLDAGRSIQVPDAPHGHVFVARGEVEFEGYGQLQQGDAVRLTRTGGHRLTAEKDGAELLVWEMHGIAANV
ncbi:pirin family protein [Mycobacteroides chelonae]|uniref:pirin family protein n=1 Tax=Mycobacteroides chelonae TaxID=1774 RepID=UPI0007B432FB|nr:pirin family protein [Mycobacteroides chelonae]ANA97154.1 pirin [Mycobacteroides chelonae CCUG 47445]OLT82788.1 pirin family protein [Mycobacteroides chelonae]ORV17707.1 pirin [Mycobacteroides chelonae]